MIFVSLPININSRHDSYLATAGLKLIKASAVEMNPIIRFISTFNTFFIRVNNLFFLTVTPDFTHIILMLSLWHGNSLNLYVLTKIN
jgi:hypothetical protein